MNSLVKQSSRLHREFNKPLIIISGLMVVFAFFLIRFTLNLPSYSPYRDIYLLLTGFLLGFVNLIVVEFTVSSKERAESKNKSRILEEQLKEIMVTGKIIMETETITVSERKQKQRDAVNIGLWAVSLIYDETYDEFMAGSVRGALSRLAAPKELMNDYKVKLKGYADYDLKIRYSLQFLKDIPCYSPEGYNLYLMSAFAFNVHHICQTLNDSVLSGNLTNNIRNFMDTIINGVTLYMWEYERVEGKLVKEINDNFIIITDNMSIMKQTLLETLQKDHIKNISEFKAKVDGLNEIVLHTLLITAIEEGTKIY